jgi:uncharacterized HAD superfamily protein
MRIALDFDGTITEHPEFFRALANGMRSQGHEIVILTYRHHALLPLMREQLTEWGIECDRFQFCHRQEDKGMWCETLGIDIFFEDTDACIGPVSSRTLVLKVRHAKNFDFEKQAWQDARRE